MFNWRAVPFVRLVVPLIAGILLAHSLSTAVPFANWLLLLVLLLLVAINRQKIAFAQRWWPAMLINSFLLLLGYQLYFGQQDLHQTKHFQRYLSDENVVAIRLLSAPTKGNWISCQATVEQINTVDKTPIETKGNLLLYFQNDNLSRQLDIGDQIIAKTTISKVRGPANPYNFDYRKYLAVQNIHFQSFVRSDQWQLANEASSFSLHSWANQTRLYFIEILNTYLPTPNEQAVGQALILGYREGLTDEIRNAYAGTGAIHVLAVSGLHVGLVYVALAFLFGLLPFRSRLWDVTKVVGMLAGVWLFALLTGASASVLRAATMFSFLIIGTQLRRQPNIYNVLAASAFCLLCINPLLLWDIGFQLSYLAVAGIVYFQPKVYRLWSIDNKAGDYLWKLVAVAIAAQLTTFPLSLYYFHQFPIYFWLSGLVVIPAATLILSGGLLLIFSAYVLPFLSPTIGWLLYGIIWIMNSLIFVIQQIPGALVSGIWISLLILLLLYAILFCVAIAIESQHIRWGIAALSLLLVISLFYNIKKWNQLKQKQLTIYHVRDHSMLEYIDGRHAYAFRTQGLSDGLKKKTAANQRQALGIKNSTPISFDRAAFEAYGLRSKGTLSQFYQQRVVLLNILPNWITEQPIPVDYLIISNNPKARLEEILQYYQPARIVIDGSNAFRQRMYWRSACTNNNIPFHDTQKQGAITLTM